MSRGARGGAWLLWVALAGLAAPAAGDSGLLDGLSFVGKIGEKGRELDPDEDEEIVFRDGRFRSASCDPYGFGTAPYSTTVDGDAVRFRAVTESPTHGTIAWEGVIDGERVRGTFVWTKERWYWDIHREYWFEATLRE